MVRFDNLYGKHIKEREYQNIVKGLHIIVQSFGMRSWIRLIEDEEELKIVKSIGIDFIQGNYLGKISTLEELESSI